MRKIGWLQFSIPIVILVCHIAGMIYLYFVCVVKLQDWELLAKFGSAMLPIFAVYFSLAVNNVIAIADTQGTPKPDLPRLSSGAILVAIFTYALVAVFYGAFFAVISAVGKGGGGLASHTNEATGALAIIQAAFGAYGVELLKRVLKT